METQQEYQKNGLILTGQKKVGDLPYSQEAVSSCAHQLHVHMPTLARD